MHVVRLQSFGLDLTTIKVLIEIEFYPKKLIKGIIQEI